MAVGTNGHMAWSQTYLYADITDWYREEVQLDENGNTSATLFAIEWKPLTTTLKLFELEGDGSYKETSLIIPTTFDGRRLLNIGGTETSQGWTLDHNHGWSLGEPRRLQRRRCYPQP